MNDKLVEANIKLLDENKILKRDVAILETRINEVIRYIKTLKQDSNLENIMKLLSGISID